MKAQRRLGWVLAAMLFGSLAAGNLRAQDQADGGSPSNDPPSRVARIQYISGEVSLQPGGVNDWVAASLNRPLTTSDRVWTDKNSRVELNVGDGFLRMDSESSLTLTNVGNNTVQAELDQGVLELTVRHLEPGEIFEVDTPNLAFTVMKSGVYRFDVRPSEDQTWVTVRKGYGEATGMGPAVKVNDGQQVRFNSQNSLQHVTYAAPSPDGFEDWAQVRDKRLDGSQSARYVAPGVIGYQDLDYYGRWQVVPTYGAIWVPNAVPAGWAPYRFGHWVWISPWGWTWVDDEPWGFAPFHYGRWVFYGGYWGWAPGPVYVGWRPYYAPALVGWIGGAGWGVGVSFGFGGGCGWFPLGWGEPYYPWYHGYRGGYVSQTYIRNVNITNTHITNITNVTNNYYRNAVINAHYVNRSIPGAVTAAPKSALASGQNIARVGMAVPRSELGRGEVVRSNDVAPTRQAMLGGRVANGSAVPPRSAFDRPVVTRSTTATHTPTSNVEARNTPVAPANVPARNTGELRVAPSRNVPHPPERNNQTNAAATSGYTAQPGPHQTVPKPPYAGGSAPVNSANAAHSAGGYQSEHGAAPTHDAVRGSQPPASSNHNTPSAKPKENAPRESSKPNPGTASRTVPRPPEGYSYQASPAYAGSTYSRGSGSNSGGRGDAAPASNYAAGRSSYVSPAPSYRTGGGYTPPPAYSARPYVPSAPQYSAPPAPRYSGAGSAGHYSGGGASSGHYSSGGGGRSSSSGGHDSSHTR